MINCHWGAGWTGREESSSGESERTPKILWSGKKRKKNPQPAYELTITRHGKASPLPNQTDFCINFNQTNVSMLRVESGFPTAVSPYSLCLIQTVLTPLLLLSPGACQISSSLTQSLWNAVFLFHIELYFRVNQAFSSVFTEMKVLGYKVSSNPTQVWFLGSIYI